MIMADLASRRKEYQKQFNVGIDETGSRYKDVMGRMIAAGETGKEAAMPDNEILSNSMAILFAGHGQPTFPRVIRLLICQPIYLETTANSLAITLALLGLYQTEQERVYQDIISVLGDERDPVGLGLA